MAVSLEPRLARISFVQGYFDDDSMLRRVVRERVVALAGPRTLLMQAAHPVAFEGFFAHTGALDDPYGRLERTARVLDLIGFGTRQQAERATARVRRMHARVRGEVGGRPFAADDPDLLLWVLATLADSAMLVYDRCVASLDRDERDALWGDYRVVGELFGLRPEDMPQSIEDFDAYMRGMLEGGVLSVTPAAREVAVQVVMHPPVPVWARGLLELANQITVGLLPPAIRAQYGFSWDPARAVAVRGGAAYVKRLLLPGVRALTPSLLTVSPRG